MLHTVAHNGPSAIRSWLMSLDGSRIHYLFLLLNMTTAARGYMSPNEYGSANMFSPSGLDIAKNNKFFQAFGNGSTNRTVHEPHHTEKTTPRIADLEPLNTNPDGFFDFEPPTNTGTPYQDQFSTPGASGLPWSGEMIFHPLSPPDSASFSPKDPWAYGLQNPTNIMTDIAPANTQAHYGQITPPNDDDDSESVLDYQLSEHQQQLHPMEPDSPTMKRKRNGSNMNEQSSAATKRTRKYASRNVNNADAPGKPEDVKRSKFLERNRVAASKCRQKKKEWTQNLENRARELQKNNNMLRLDVDSLRQEVLFLKGEILKHSSCDCSQIQEFVKSGSGPDSFLDARDDGISFKREQSPIEIMPGSPASRPHGSLRDFDDESSSPAAETMKTSIVNDEPALEALLSSSMNHDSSDEGAHEQVSG